MRLIYKRDRDIRGGILPKTVNKIRQHYQIGDTITRTVTDLTDGEQYSVDLCITAKYPHFLIAEGWGRYAGRKLSVSIRYVDLCLEEINRPRRRRDRKKK